MVVVVCLGINLFVFLGSDSSPYKVKVAAGEVLEENLFLFGLLY